MNYQWLTKQWYCREFQLTGFECIFTAKTQMQIIRRMLQCHPQIEFSNKGPEDTSANFSINQREKKFEPETLYHICLQNDCYKDQNANMKKDVIVQPVDGIL